MVVATDTVAGILCVVFCHAVLPLLRKKLSDALQADDKKEAEKRHWSI